MICTICNSKHNKSLFTLNATQTIYHCLNCDLQFLDPQLNDIELTKLYSENYYKAWGLKAEEENIVIKKMKIATFKLRLNAIQKYVKSGKILDVGCATGFFLEIAEQKNFNPFGVEFSKYSSDIAKRKFGEKNIFNGIIEDCNFEEKQFDVIAMSDLIEHVRNPIKTLSKATSLLNEKGVIMIMTPNTGATSNKIMRKRWTHYKLEHFFYFNKKSMSILAENCGMEIIFFEKSKKAMNIDYLYTQFSVYRHWFFTPLIKTIKWLLPSKIASHNFYISIGEMVVLLKKKNGSENYK